MKVTSIELTVKEWYLKQIFFSIGGGIKNMKI